MLSDNQINMQDNLSLLLKCDLIILTTNHRIVSERKWGPDTTVNIRASNQGTEMHIEAIHGDGRNKQIYISSKIVIEKESLMNGIIIRILDFRTVLIINDILSHEIESILNLMEPSSTFLSINEDKENCPSESNKINSENTLMSPKKKSNTNIDQLKTISTPPKSLIYKSHKLTPVKSGCSPEEKRKKPTIVSQKFQNDFLQTHNLEDILVQNTLSINSLSNEQTIVIDACLNGRNVFITGGAGTGKSFLLKLIMQQLVKKYDSNSVFITATTGLAACSLGGTTVHQFGGFRPSDEELFASGQINQLRHKSSTIRRWMNAKVLIIDEISMLHVSTLEMLNYIAQSLRGNSKPMGGIQIIFCGDFFQLPPITASSNKIGLYSTETKENSILCNRFCFQSLVWNKCSFLTFLLNNKFRQQEPFFVSLLDDVRWGNISDNLLRAFDCCVNRKLDCRDGILPTRLFTHKKHVDNLNDQELNALPGDTLEYIAHDQGDEEFIHMLNSFCPARKVLKLKIGAQVMLLKNLHFGDKNNGLVNGSRGVVVRFSSDPKRPIIKFTNGISRAIGNEIFHISLGSKIICQREQLPLSLAWGISIHKAQGITVEKAVIDIRHAFEFGQAYVALSRVKSLSGLSLTHGLQKQHIKTDETVKQFYSSLITREEKNTSK